MIRKLLSFAMMLAISISLSAQATWTQQNTNFTAYSYGVGVDQVNAVSPSIVWVKGFNGTGAAGKLAVFSKTNDGGTTWSEGFFTTFGTNIMPAMLGATSFTNAFATAYDTVALAASFWGTTDGGANWSAVSGVLNSASSFADGVYFWNSTQGFCYGDPVGTSPNKKFEIFTTANGGTSWTVNTNTPLAVPQTEYGYNGADCACIVPGGIGFIMTDHGRVLKTTDFGITWAVTTTAPFPNAAYNGVKITASSANYIIAAYYTTSTSLWAYKYTTDGGVTWSDFVPAAPFYEYQMCYVPGSTNTFVATSPYSSTQVGVAYSTDGGLTWTDYTDPLLQPTGSNIQCLAVGFADQQNGWVGNYDNGGAINSILYFHDPTAGVTLNSVNGNDVNVYPNPSNGLVNFTVNGPNKSDISIKVVDMLGKVVFTENINVNSLSATQFDFSNFAKGMYVVQITSGNDIKTQKLMIK